MGSAAKILAKHKNLQRFEEGTFYDPDGDEVGLEMANCDWCLFGKSNVENQGFDCAALSERGMSQLDIRKHHDDVIAGKECAHILVDFRVSREAKREILQLGGINMSFPKAEQKHPVSFTVAGTEVNDPRGRVMDVATFKAKYSAKEPSLKTNLTGEKLSTVCKTFGLIALFLFWLAVWILGVIEGFSLAFSGSNGTFLTICFTFLLLGLIAQVPEKNIDGLIAKLILAGLAVKFLLNFLGETDILQWVYVIPLLLCYALFEFTYLIKNTIFFKQEVAD